MLLAGRRLLSRCHLIDKGVKAGEAECLVGQAVEVDECRERVAILTGHEQFTKYQLSLSEEVNRISKDFQQKVLVSILYNRQFDTVRLDEIRIGQGSEIKDGLIDACKALGIFDDEVAQRIEEPVAAIDKSSMEVQPFAEPSYGPAQKVVEDLKESLARDSRWMGGQNN